MPVSVLDKDGGLAQLGEHLLCKQGGRRFDPVILHHFTLILIADASVPAGVCISDSQESADVL